MFQVELLKMFNNLVNYRDFLLLKSAIKEERIGSIIQGLLVGKKQKIINTWSRTERPLSWWDIPEVQKRWNYLITGDSTTDVYQYISRKFLADKDSLFGLSLGCGDGSRKLKWAETGKFRTIIGYDISKRRISRANREAKQRSLDNIATFRCRDIFSIEEEDNYYDVIFTEGALHHFSPLESILCKINRMLDQNGYYLVNDFIGPTQFQWTERQLEIINGALSILPSGYRRMANTDSIVAKIYKPSRLSMMLSDPSEAVQSSSIMSLLERHFDIVEIKPYGGTILHPLLHGIAHNFLSNDSLTQKFLYLLFDLEDLLLKSGDVNNDFAVVICRKSIARSWANKRGVPARDE